MPVSILLWVEQDFWNAQPALVWKPRDCVLVWRRKYRDFFLNAHILVDWVLSATKIKLEHLSLLSFLFDFNLFVSVVIPLVMLWYLSVYFQVLVPSQPKQRNLCSYVFSSSFSLTFLWPTLCFLLLLSAYTARVCVWSMRCAFIGLNFHFKAVLTVFKMKTYSNILKRNVDKASKIVCETFSFWFGLF